MTVYTARETPNKQLTAALGIAALSRCKNQHGSLMVKNGAIVGAATNQKRHTPINASWRSSHVHSEEALLRGVSAKGG